MWRGKPGAIDAAAGARKEDQQRRVPPARINKFGTSQVVLNTREMQSKRKQLQDEHKKQRDFLASIKAADPGNPYWHEEYETQQHRKLLDLKPLEYLPKESAKIMVCVRERPLIQSEIKAKVVNILSVPSTDVILVHAPEKTLLNEIRFNLNKFRFDFVFEQTCSNELIYQYTAKPLIKHVFSGGMATCFAYGQTGTGKTYTMSGQELTDGIYGRTAADIFDMLEQPEFAEEEFQVHISFFEIYNTRLYDLFNSRHQLKLLEDGKKSMVVFGLTKKRVLCTADVLEHLAAACRLRVVGVTKANPDSSRSHAIFEIMLFKPNTKDPFGKFAIIDLAGSERGAVSKNNATTDEKRESREINTSLLALKECIRGMQLKSTRIPFRDSGLTKVLRDSFVGNKNKLVMIATISPGLCNSEDTMNTLRYADRVKGLSARDD